LLKAGANPAAGFAGRVAELSGIKEANAAGLAIVWRRFAGSAINACRTDCKRRMLVSSFPTRFATAFVVAVATLAGFVAPSARGDIIVSYQDVGSDLQFSWSGSLDLSGGGSFSSTLALIAAGASSGTSTHQYIYGFSGSYSTHIGNSFTRSPAPNTEWLFGNAADFISSTTGASILGDTFGMSFLTSNNTATIFLPANYVSGTAISGSMTIPNQSVSSTGLSPASFTLGGGDGVISFQAVPEPSALALCVVAAAGLGFAGVRRRSRRPRCHTSNRC
jgi:hypothetical protein